MEIARKDVFVVSFWVVACVLFAYPDNPYSTYRMVVLGRVRNRIPRLAAVRTAELKPMTEMEREQWIKLVLAVAIMLASILGFLLGDGTTRIELVILTFLVGASMLYEWFQEWVEP